MGFFHKTKAERLGDEIVGFMLDYGFANAGKILADCAPRMLCFLAMTKWVICEDKR
ncbi:hypothetical protein [Helicobacter rodentium]|uniref:hypothetical protein n=1 Tax=Helicobacter rodentium TaxID=59617 RepID=UPI000B1321DE|nr:hypothetical protein [Helicobacter rodentium]